MTTEHKIKYAASAAMTVTNLHSLAADQAWLAGWFSASVANTSNNYIDYLVGGTFTTHASNKQVGRIEVWVIASLNDTPTWPAANSGTIGTEGAGSFVDTEEKYALCRFLAALDTDASASQILAFPQTSIAQLFGGHCPTHWALFVTGNGATTTAAQLASSGSAIYYTPITYQSA